MTDVEHASVAVGPIHPAIDHALAAFSMPDAAQAAAAIRYACGSRIASGLPEAWKGSRLTGDGFPFEIAFSTGDARLRFTLEPGPRTAALHERLDCVVKVAQSIGTKRFPVQVLDGLRELQAHAPLTYGAWLGCRAGAMGTACKLYVEVPKNAPYHVNSLVLDDRKVVPRMLAYDPASQAFEAYCRVPSLQPRHLAPVLALVGAEGRAQWLLDFIEEAHGHRVRERLPGSSVGVSFLRHAAEPRLTLYFHARAVWGSDARIRRGFLRVTQGSGWDAEPYLRITAPIANRNDWRTYHGLFSITIDARPAATLGIGVRPIAP